MHTILFFFLFLFSSTSLLADKDDYEINESVTLGPCEVTLQLHKKEISILDQQKFVLKVKAPSEFSIEFPGLDERLEDFRIVPWRANDYTNDETSVSYEKYYAFELYESGEQMIPPIEILVSSGNVEQLETRSYYTNPIPFKINSVDASKYLNQELKPKAGVAGLKPFPWLMVGLCIFGAALLIGLFFYIFDRYAKKKQAPPPPPTPAHLLAYQELQAIVDQHEKGEMDIEDFANQLSNVLRRYIERRFYIRAYESTTEEFLELAVSHESVSTHKSVLQQFLEYADLIKFAKQKAEKDDVQKGFNFIKEFIESTKQLGASA